MQGANRNVLGAPDYCASHRHVHSWLHTRRCRIMQLLYRWSLTIASGATQVLHINPAKTDIDDFAADDFTLVGYEPHKKIVMQMAV